MRKASPPHNCLVSYVTCHIFFFAQSGDGSVRLDKARIGAQGRGKSAKVFSVFWFLGFLELRRRRKNKKIQ